MNRNLEEKKYKISVIIVNLNTGNVLKKCVESVIEYETDKNAIEIIIVDQNSTDNSKDIIKSLSDKYEFVKYIFNDSLKGFSHSNNIGFDISSGEYIVIMNPDIIFTQEVFDKLINRFWENSNIGALCPLLIGEDSEFQGGYYRHYPSLSQFILFYMIFSKPSYKSSFLRGKYFEHPGFDITSGKLEYVEQIPCAFFFTKRNIFESCGKMDENYVLFFEDVDLSFQINKQYKLAIDTSCSVMHLGGVSFNTVDNWWLHGRFVKSMHYFFKKNKNPISSFLLFLLAVINSCVIVIFEYVKSLIGKRDINRLKKHKHLLKLFIPFLDKK